MSDEYEPCTFERRWSEAWRSDPSFGIDSSRPAQFVMIQPAPNVTGRLHMGHALNIVLQDVVVRAQHLRGRKAVWIPGTDHGGIATQAVLEQQLAARGQARAQLGRDGFRDIAWAWKEWLVPEMKEQIRALGAAPDFASEYFTMDPVRTRGVREAFVRLHERGLIYRADGVVNWCPRCETALSEMELEIRQEVETFFVLKYELEGGGGPLPVMTMRPETLAADAAVAVNPSDRRYAALVGRTVRSPLFDAPLPVRAEPHVTPSFGDGVVRLTPHHSPTDYVIAKRDGLPAEAAIGRNGVTTGAMREFGGLDRFECRARVARALEQRGLVLRTERHPHGNAYCYRCSTLVEPFPVEQWYLRIHDLLDPVVRSIESGEIDVQPEGLRKTIVKWTENLKERHLARESWWEGSCVAVQMGFASNKDWCISRQIWWGHDIPAWTCDRCRRTSVATTTPERCHHCGAATLTQDPDVLDVWFSSALWPLNVMGWPQQTDELQGMFPQSLAVTGHDVVYFWVVPTIMLVHALAGRKPYDRILLHGLVCDREGRKMSKSFGNVISPDEVIRRHGADALRLALALRCRRDGEDLRIGEEDFANARQIIQLLWDIALEVARLTHPVGPGIEDHRAAASTRGQPLFDALEQVRHGVSDALDRYDFAHAADLAVSFLRDHLIEEVVCAVDQLGVRREEGQDRLAHARSALREFLLVLHPFTPFVTEELWTRLGEGRSILAWPATRRRRPHRAECAQHE
jgi:valyl-tRNA synthetase